MNWDAIGAIGEVVGAVAVLATLLYLGKQIKNNTKEVRADNVHRVTDSFNAINLTIFQNEEVAELWLKGITDYSSMSDTEKLRFDFGWLSAFRVYDSMYYQVQSGTGETELFQTELATLKWFFSYPGARDWWRSQKFALSPGFREYVDKAVAEMEDAPSDRPLEWGD